MRAGGCAGYSGFDGIAHGPARTTAAQGVAPGPGTPLAAQPACRPRRGESLTSPQAPPIIEACPAQGRRKMGTGSVAQVGLAAGETLPPRCLSPFSAGSGADRRGKVGQAPSPQAVVWGDCDRGDGASPLFRDWRPCVVVLRLPTERLVPVLRTLWWLTAAWICLAGPCAGGAAQGGKLAGPIARRYSYSFTAARRWIGWRPSAGWPISRP